MNPLAGGPLNNPFMPMQQQAAQQGFGTGGTMEGTYGAFWSAYEGAFRNSAAALEAAGIAWVADLLIVVLPLLTITWAILMGSGQMNVAVAHKYGWRLLFLLWLVVGGAYATTVHYVVLDAFPTELASRIHGEGAANFTMIDQFEIIDTTIKHFGSVFGGQATGVRYTAERLNIQFTQWIALGFLKLMFFIWIAMRAMLYIVVIIGAFVIISIPFDTTIGFIRAVFGKMVALSVWQIGSATALKIMLSGYMVWLDNMKDSNLPTLQHMMNTMGDIAWWSVGCLVIFILLPGMTAVGSGIVAGATVVQGAIFGAVGAAVGVGGRIAGNIGAATSRMISR